MDSVSSRSGADLLVGAHWFDVNWMLINLPFAFLLFVWLLFWPRPSKFSLKWHTCALSCCYVLHQLEEHGWDLRGWRFSFAPLFAAQTGLMVTPRMITLVNVPLVWVAFPLIALQAKVFNAVFAHILPALVTRSYNAGLLQSVFMSVIGIAILHRFARPIYGVRVILLGLVALGAAQHVFGVLLPFVLIDKFKVSAWIIVPCVVGSVWWVPSQIAKHGI